MNGEELKQRVKRSGMSISDLAEELGTSPQNLNARFKRKSVKLDFLEKVEAILNRCCPPLPAEMEVAVSGSNVNGSNSPNVSQTIGDNSALLAENKLLREQNDFLQKQVETLLKIVGK